MDPVSYVNGFECSSCKEISLAKRGIDPRNPDHDPIKQQELDLKAGKVPTDTVLGKDVVQASLASGATSADPQTGRQVDLYV